MKNAKKYYLESLIIKEEIGDKHGIAIISGNLGVVYNSLSEYNNALKYSLIYYKISEELGDKRGLGISLGAIGSTYLKMKEYKKAEINLKKSLQFLEEIGALNDVKTQHEQLSFLYEVTNQPSLSLIHFKKYIAIRDSLFSEENTKQTMEMELNHQYEKQKLADSISNVEAEKVHKANLEAEKAKGAQQQSELRAQKKQNVFLFIGIGLVALFGFFMYNRFKVTQKQKGIIEEKEKETSIQKHLIEEKHKEITDSINYAERIQRSFLASREMLDSNLSSPFGGGAEGGGGYFVFFKPKDVVSGDFYWSSILKNGNFAFCCADITGHGVPGAIMSILNISSLEKAIETASEPHLILNKTRELIIERLKKDGSPEGGKDGMDCSLLVLNHYKTELCFASANNPVFIVRQTPPILPIGEDKGGVELLEFRPDKMPVGKHDKDQEPFTLQTVSLQKGDVIYTLTDGFPDQFGGEKGKKYMIKNLKELFLSISHLPMKEQEELLDQEFKNWKGSNEQIDDVCIIGVRV